MEAAEIRVSAATSLAPALKEIGAMYERQTGDRVLFSYGPTSTLARQIEAGAPADLFLAADEEKMQQLESRGLIDRQTRRAFLTNRLVVIVPAASRQTLRSLLDLRKPSIGRVALADPASVPAGIYARRHLEHEGIWEDIVKKIVPTQSARATVAVTAAGNVDAAIVYLSDARSNEQVRIAILLPLLQGNRISYPFAVTTNAREKAAALRFLDFLESMTARNVFRKHGFPDGG